MTQPDTASRQQTHGFQFKSLSLPNYPVCLTAVARISSLQSPPSDHYLLTVPNRDLVSLSFICYSCSALLLHLLIVRVPHAKPLHLSSIQEPAADQFSSCTLHCCSRRASNAMLLTLSLSSPTEPHSNPIARGQWGSYPSPCTSY